MALMTSTNDIFRLSFKTEVPAADCFGYVSSIRCPPNKAAKPDFIKPRPGRPPRLASHLRHIGPAVSPSRMDLHAVYRTSTGQMDIPYGQMDSLCCASWKPSMSHLFPRYAGNSPPINLICSSRKVGRRSQTLLKKRGKLTDALTHMPTPTKTSLKKKQIESPATQTACSGPAALLPCCLAALLPCCPATVLPCCSAAPAALLPCYSAT